MLELFARHGGFDLKLRATGDLDVDQHHTVEDAGIVLGQLFAEGARRPPRHQPRRLLRHADGRDAGGGGRRPGRPARPGLQGPGQERAPSAICRRNWWRTSFGDSSTHAGANLHVKVLYGRSSHHKLEADLQVLCARALKYACSHDRRLRGQLPSTKGLL